MKGEEKFISHVRYVFSRGIEILRGSRSLTLVCGKPVNFTAEVSAIAESTVYPFFSFHQENGSFRHRMKEIEKKVGPGWRAREISANATQSESKPSQADGNNGETKSGKKFSDNGAVNRGSSQRRHVLAAAALEINFDLTMRTSANVSVDFRCTTSFYSLGSSRVVLKKFRMENYVQKSNFNTVILVSMLIDDGN